MSSYPSLLVIIACYVYLLNVGWMIDLFSSSLFALILWQWTRVTCCHKFPSTSKIPLISFPFSLPSLHCHLHCIVLVLTIIINLIIMSAQGYYCQAEFHARIVNVSALRQVSKENGCNIETLFVAWAAFSSIVESIVMLQEGCCDRVFRLRRHHRSSSLAILCRVHNILCSAQQCHLSHIRWTVDILRQPIWVIPN